MPFGKDDDAGGNAAAVQKQANDEAIAELKRQFGVTQKNIKPFLNAGKGMLPDVIEGTTASGLDSRLANIFNTDIFGSLVDERTRAVEGQLAAGGLTRSGTAINEAADVRSDIALMIEDMLNGRATNLAGSGQNAALGLGSLGAQNSSSIANLLNSSGVAGAEGILTDARSSGQAGQNGLNLAAAFGGAAVDAGGVGSLVSGFFSDPRLKENIEEIGTIYIENPNNKEEPLELSLSQWDWVKQTKDTIVSQCPTIGFMADKVKEIFPEYVSEFGGFMMVDYPRLLNRLEAA